MNITRRLCLVARVMGESTCYWLVACAVFGALVLLFPAVRFAARYDGGCGGWTSELSLVYTAADLGTCWAYFAIAIAILRLHPVLSYVPAARVTVTLVIMIFLSCGLDHLVAAFANFEPHYLPLAWIKGGAALIGIVGACFIAHDLVWVNNRLRDEDEEIQRAKEDLFETRRRMRKR